MYNLFVKNLENYILLNQVDFIDDEFRISIVRPLEGLMSVDKFKLWEKENFKEYKELSNIIYEIGERIMEYRSFKVFSWELWGYGFDGEQSFDFKEEIVNEQLKLIDLLLGTHYWIN